MVEWQAHYFEGVALRGVRVQISLTAPNAGLAELADALDLGSSGEIHKSSILLSCTIIYGSRYAP